MKGNRFSSLKNAFSNSVVISLLNKVSDFFYSKICSSKSAQALNSYDDLESKCSNSFLTKAISGILPRKKFVLDLKNKVSGKIETCLFYSLMHRLIDFLLGTKLRVYGVILFIIGIFSAGIGALQTFALNAAGSQNPLLWQGIAFAVFSIPFLLSKEELCVSLTHGRVSRAVIKFIGYKNEEVIRKPVGENLAIPVLIGVLLGAVSTVVQPLYIILAVMALVYLGVVIHKPEISIVITVATLPFLPTMVICGELILTLVAYLLKVARGKRSFSFGVLDACVFAFAIFMFFGGIFSVTPSSSIPPMCVFVCFLSSYFLIVNLIKTKELLKKLLLSSVLAFTVCSLYGIYQNFFAAPDATWTDEDMFSDIATRVVSTFENPNVFGEYLITLIPVVLTVLLLSKSFAERTFSLGAMAVGLLALVYTWSRGAWLGCIASIIVFAVIINKHALSTYIVGALFLPLCVPFLPTSILDRFSSIGNMADSSTSYRVFIWEASANIIKDYFVSGIGIGTDAFQLVYSDYALAGIETAPHSHNLYLQIMIELGILGFAVFAFTVFIFYSKCFTFIKNTDSRSGRLIVGAILCGLLAILVQGLTDYVWYNYRVFAFFWMMFATASAAANIYKAEKQTDENLM